MAADCGGSMIWWVELEAQGGRLKSLAERDRKTFIMNTLTIFSHTELHICFRGKLNMTQDAGVTKWFESLSHGRSQIKIVF